MGASACHINSVANAEDSKYQPVAAGRIAVKTVPSGAMTSKRGEESFVRGCVRRGDRLEDRLAGGHERATGAVDRSFGLGRRPREVGDGFSEVTVTRTRTGIESSLTPSPSMTSSAA